MALRTAGALDLLIVLLGVVCLVGAAYLAYLRNVVGCGLLLVVAIVCFYLSG